MSLSNIYFESMRGLTPETKLCYTLSRLTDLAVAVRD
jgi:hypothetical protein